MVCEKCGQKYELDYRKYPKGLSKYCSRSCANSRSMTDENKKKIKDGVIKNNIKNNKIRNKCIGCGMVISHRNNQKFCRECKRKYRKIDGNYVFIKEYRQKRKEKCLEYKGGKCEICGYNKCSRSMEFHHTNPKEKEFNIGKSIKSWEKTKIELDKCILVCRNCHGEIHDEIDRNNIHNKEYKV